MPWLNARDLPGSRVACWAFSCFWAGWLCYFWPSAWLTIFFNKIPPLDFVQAEAEVAQRRENLIRARTLAENAEDSLRRLIADPGDASFWRVRLTPLEEPTPVGPAPDVDAAVAQALDKRYDLARAGQELENAETTVAFLRNQRLPDVRLETS